MVDLESNDQGTQWRDDHPRGQPFVWVLRLAAGADQRPSAVRVTGRRCRRPAGWAIPQRRPGQPTAISYPVAGPLGE
jgi:hypothetical protein